MSDTRPHEPPALRCSDADRERTSAALHSAAGEGRLTMDEAEERLALAYAARHHHELDALVADLPAPDVPQGNGSWGLVVAAARRQLAADIAALSGRGPMGSVDTRQRLRAALALLTVLALVGLTVAMLLHGIIGDGPERWDGIERG